MIQTQPLPTALGLLFAGVQGREALRQLRGVELCVRTRGEAEQLADLLATRLPEPVLGRLGLVELMLNAIEHGNLEIGGALKAQLLREQRFEAEIAARLAREPYRSRRVRVVITAVEPVIEIEIRDDGPGFAWRGRLAAGFEPSDAPNGRGIALVRTAAFPGLTYRDPGNVAVVRLPWPA